MHGTFIVRTPTTSKSFTSGSVAPMGERIVYVLLGLVLIGAIVPIGPTIPNAQNGAVPPVCSAPDETVRHLVSCAVDDRLALAQLSRRESWRP